MLGGLRVVVVLATLLVTCGCTTPYGPYTFLIGGYTDEAIGNDQYHISIVGNHATDVGTAEQYFFRRAQEIAKEHGYERYSVIAMRSGLERGGDGIHPVARGVIQGVGGNGHGGGARSGGGSGTGFFLGADGTVLTNHHVVAQCREITIRQRDGTVTPATVLASDGSNDLAVLKTAARPSSYARFRAAPDIRRGDNVVAFGFPLSNVLSSGGAVTTGTVSALAGAEDDSRELQISAPIQPGNSGGPLLDQSGNVVGITSSTLNRKSQNVNFAIKASVARGFLDTHSVNYEQAPSSKTLSTSDIAALAERFAVYIVCTGG